MIEIEMKFLLTDDQKEQLLAGAVNLGNLHIIDAYMDTDDFRLTTNDYWFRLRDGAYELKAPLVSGSGSYAATNRYNEITDLEEIKRELKLDSVDDFDTALSEAGIAPFMTCYTNRTSYEKDGFHIDIDTATYLDSDFTYAVAEIELLVKDEADADVAEQKILELAREYRLSTDEVIPGKVAAYLEAESPEHYRVLVEAGVLK